jgi:phthalate 4,5-cis-dihydrodiol dehydrogenase
MPGGVVVYDDAGARLEPLGAPGIPRREGVVEVHAAIEYGTPALHDGRWARATLELCGALLESARTHDDVRPIYQVPVSAAALR